jgi:hypothetical protein
VELHEILNEHEPAHDAVAGIIKGRAIVKENDDVCKSIKLRRRLVEVSCLNSIVSAGLL